MYNLHICIQCINYSSKLWANIVWKTFLALCCSISSCKLASLLFQISLRLHLLSKYFIWCVNFNLLQSKLQFGFKVWLALPNFHLRFRTANVTLNLMCTVHTSNNFILKYSTTRNLPQPAQRWEGREIETWTWQCRQQCQVSSSAVTRCCCYLTKRTKLILRDEKSISFVDE